MSFHETSKLSPGGYDPSFFARLAAVEDEHFWFRARNELILRTVAHLAASLPCHARIAEIGCGTGNVLRWLRQACPGCLVVGVDMCHEGLRYAKERTDCFLVQAEIRSLPFSHAFHLIGVFDVLEHVADDREALRRLRGVLVDRGWLIVTVPARVSLWSYFDDASGHCRRYSRKQLAERLHEAGFQLQFESEFMAPLLPAVWLWRKIIGAILHRGSPPKKAAFGELRIVPGINGLLTWLLRAEARRIARGHRSPFGVSLLAVARA